MIGLGGGVKKVLKGAYLLKQVFFLYLLGVVGGLDRGGSMGWGWSNQTI